MDADLASSPPVVGDHGRGPDRAGDAVTLGEQEAGVASHPEIGIANRRNGDREGGPNVRSSMLCILRSGDCRFSTPTHLQRRKRHPLAASPAGRRAGDRLNWSAASGRPGGSDGRAVGHPVEGCREPTEVDLAMEIILANPRGFCAGVNMAIESLERSLDFFGAPVYVYHEIVHNKYVVERFKSRGVVFVESLDEVPHGSPCSTARTASRRRSATRPASGTSGRSTRPARWSPRSTSKPSSTPRKGTRSS